MTRGHPVRHGPEPEGDRATPRAFGPDRPPPSPEGPEPTTCLANPWQHTAFSPWQGPRPSLCPWPPAPPRPQAILGRRRSPELTVGSAPSLAGLGLQVAISQEAACKDNLIVTSTVNKSAYDSMPQLLSGGLQVAQMDTITFLQAHTQGLPVQIIAANAEQSTDGEPGQLSSASVVTTPDSPITSPKDLAGKKVGVPAIKTQTWMNIRAIVDADGGDSAQIEFVEVPLGPDDRPAQAGQRRRRHPERTPGLRLDRQRRRQAGPQHRRARQQGSAQLRLRREPGTSSPRTRTPSRPS